MKKLTSVGLFSALIAINFLFAAPAFAGSATWDLNPGSNDWNTGNNWTAVTVPNGVNDTATFELSNKTSVSIATSTDIQINGMSFTSNASNPFTITVNGTLFVSGAGITNNSGVNQSFITTIHLGVVPSSDITFGNSATAGTGTVFTNNAPGATNATAGIMTFVDNATAGSATINNNGNAADDSGVAVNNSLIATTFFFSSSTAGNATINNNGGTVSGALGGHTQFDNNATAGSATINNNPGTANGALPGGTSIFSSAGSATINNNGASLGGTLGGGTEIVDGTAASATINNNGASVNNGGGGQTLFSAGGDAGSAIINNNPATTFGGGVGETDFRHNSTAGNATINNNAASVSGANGGETQFYGDTTLGKSTAGSATINNNAATIANAGAGETFFNGISDAGSATINNKGSAEPGAAAGETQFKDQSSAASATIVSNGGVGLFATGGETIFSNSSDAHSATLIANGGTHFGIFPGIGFGGAILFKDNSTGGTSRVEVFGNGIVDLSSHNAPGLTIGSLEGSGNVFLGSNNLTVGSNNRSTTFSGVVHDGQFGGGGGTGGSLTKIGTGTLTLSGTNTYTGATNVSAGVLQVDGSITSNTSVNSGGTLAGTGRVNGSVTNNGGTVSPGDAPGTLTVNSFTQMSNGTLLIQIAAAGAGQFSLLNVLGTSSLDGTLDPVLLNGFIPTVGEQFVFLDYPSHSGAFSNIANQIFDNGMEEWQVTYENTDAFLTVEATSGTSVPDRGSTFLFLGFSLFGLMTYHRFSCSVKRT